MSMENFVEVVCVWIELGREQHMAKAAHLAQAWQSRGILGVTPVLSGTPKEPGGRKERNLSKGTGRHAWVWGENATQARTKHSHRQEQGHIPEAPQGGKAGSETLDLSRQLSFPNTKSTGSLGDSDSAALGQDPGAGPHTPGRFLWPGKSGEHRVSHREHDRVMSRELPGLRSPRGAGRWAMSPSADVAASPSGGAGCSLSLPSITFSAFFVASLFALKRQEAMKGKTARKDCYQAFHFFSRASAFC